MISYTPHKPGRPSHAIHTYWIGNLRLVLDAQLDSGNRHSPAHSRAGLVALLEGLPQAQRPQLVRGDSAFGSEGEMAALEAMDPPYLFKLRQSQGVKKLVQRQWNRPDWCDEGQGWQASEDTLRLSGWSQCRRVIVMRHARRIDLALEVKRKGSGRGKEHGQTELHFIDENEPVKSWEYAVLVCNTHYALAQLGQLYRDRADCENGFDEIKNQWGWYVRLAHPKARLQAMTSRPKLLAAVGKMTSHVMEIAPQLDKPQRWFALVRYIVEQILACQPAATPVQPAAATG